MQDDLPLAINIMSSAPAAQVGWFGVFDCSCLVPSFDLMSIDTLSQAIATVGAAVDPEVEAKRARRMQLVKGNNFLRPAVFGLSSQELLVQLSEDTAVLKWKAVAANFLTGATEFGQVDLGAVRCVQMKGVQGLEVIGLDDKTKKECTLMALTAESAEVRDRWVACLSELLADWARDASLKPKTELTAAGTSNKEAYFKARDAEIKAREKENAKKKEKYGNVGMKYTALAMIERG